MLKSNNPNNAIFLGYNDFYILRGLIDFELFINYN